MSNNGHEDPVALETTKSALDQVMEGADKLTAASGAISEGEKQSAGVLKSLITIEDKEDYQQILYLAKFLTFEQASKVAAAIEEAFRYDLTLRPIMTWVVAQCAVGGNKTWSGMSRAELGALGVIRREINIPNYGQNKKEGDPEKRQMSAL